MKRLYEGKRRLQVLEANRRYRAKHPELVMERNKAWRENNRDYHLSYRQRNGELLRDYYRKWSKSKEHKTHKAAQQKVRRAIRSGRLTKPSVCTKCGNFNRKIHGHHPDYSKPLDVQWLCQNCHIEVHHHYA
jgi:hypothetical protein